MAPTTPCSHPDGWVGEDGWWRCPRCGNWLPRYASTRSYIAAMRTMLEATRRKGDEP